MVPDPLHKKASKSSCGFVTAIAGLELVVILSWKHKSFNLLLLFLYLLGGFMSDLVPDAELLNFTSVFH